MEYAVKPVRPVSLCTGKTLYRFGLLKVELKKDNIEKNTPALSISGRIKLQIIVNFFGIETEFESLFCTDRPTSFECIQSNYVEANLHFHHSSVFGVTFLLVRNRFSQDTSHASSRNPINSMHVLLQRVPVSDLHQRSKCCHKLHAKDLSDLRAVRKLFSSSRTRVKKTKC